MSENINLIKQTNFFVDITYTVTTFVCVILGIYFFKIESNTFVA